MKFTIAQDAFLKGLQQVQSVISTHSTVPILFNIMIQADKQGLNIEATDGSVSVRCAAEATVTKTGMCTFPARRLVGIIRELPAAEIDMEVSESHVGSIQCGSSHYKMFGLAADEYPAIKTMDFQQSVTLPQQVLGEMMKRTLYAASVDTSRAILNGLLFAFHEQKLTMVATDGRRLALVEQEIECPAELQQDLVVPTKAIAELVKVLAGEDPVTVKWLPNLVFFDTGKVQVVSKLIEGKFPNFRQVIPSQCEERVTMDREQVLAAVRRASLVASERNPTIKLTFAKNQLQIVTITPDVGEAHETLPIKYTGKAISLVFNPEYLMDPLRALTSDDVAMEMVDEMSPAIIKCDIPFLYVLMPLRLT